MSDYHAQVRWERRDANFLANKYSRAHTWQFDGGLSVPASASPHIVPAPWADPTALDPEEAFVASLSSCHMLFFLAFASKRGFCVESYFDNATGTLAKRADGRMAMTEVVLRPKVMFSGDTIPDSDTLNALHHQAHEHCFIANSVTCDVRCEPITAEG